jgi:hypothetical protein
VDVTEWAPATDAEAAMRHALRTDDQESYFRILAGIDLLLPVSADALAGLAPLGWGTWSTGGRTHVLAFTSPAALQACLAEYTGSARRVAYSELADTWPNLEWWLAVNPGLPIEGYLPAWFVAQLSRGDLRLPARGPAPEGARPAENPPDPQTAGAPGGPAAQGDPSAAAARADQGGYGRDNGGRDNGGRDNGGRDDDFAGPDAASGGGYGFGAPAQDHAAALHDLQPGGSGTAGPVGGGSSAQVGPGGLPIRMPGGVLPSGLPSRVPTTPPAGQDRSSFPGFSAGEAGGGPAAPSSAAPSSAAPSSAAPSSAAPSSAVPAAYRPPDVPGAPGSLSGLGTPRWPANAPTSSAAPASGPPNPFGTAAGPAATAFDRLADPTETPADQWAPRRQAFPDRAFPGQPGSDLVAPGRTGPDYAVSGAAGPDRAFSGAADLDQGVSGAAGPDQGGFGQVGLDQTPLGPRTPGGTISVRRTSGQAFSRLASGMQPQPGGAEPGQTGPGQTGLGQTGLGRAQPEETGPAPASLGDLRGPLPTRTPMAQTPPLPSHIPSPEAADHNLARPEGLPRRPITPPSARPASMAAAAQALAGARTPPATPALPAPSGVVPPVIPGSASSAGPAAPSGPAAGRTVPTAGPNGPAILPAAVRTSIPAEEPSSPEPLPEDYFVGANDVERELYDAAEEGSTDRFLSTLLLATVLVPVANNSRPGSGPGESGFVFRTEEVDGERFLVVFTSRDRLAEHFAEPTRTVGVRFYELIRNWPDPAWSFAVNPESPVGATYPGPQVIALASWAAEAGLGADPAELEERPVAPVPAPEKVSDAAQHATVMQKTVPSDQVDYYLERGYDRVAGFVHRANEVEHLRTPVELFGALGLVNDGSPYQADAKEAYVLRWPAYRPSLYRIPYGGQSEQALRAMDGWVIERPPFRGNGFAPGEGRDVIAEFKVDSVRLPHGAQLWRVDADGTEKMVAIFDCDTPVWRRVGDQS